ncbi:MAG: hypothetical protein ACRDYA_13470 [Egibacteraceae bacterium]
MISMTLFILLVVILSVCIGWLIGTEQKDNFDGQLDEAVRIELETLRAANRISLAAWQAREEMHAEAERYRAAEQSGDDQSW